MKSLNLQLAAIPLFWNNCSFISLFLTAGGFEGDQIYLDANPLAHTAGSAQASAAVVL